MSLVQPPRTSPQTKNACGVKRPYQLMINNAAHNSATDASYPGKLKNLKLDKESIMDELSEDNPVCISPYVFINQLLYILNDILILYTHFLYRRMDPLFMNWHMMTCYIMMAPKNH